MGRVKSDGRVRARNVATYMNGRSHGVNLSAELGVWESRLLQMAR